jgi:hypothetical protein
VPNFVISNTKNRPGGNRATPLLLGNIPISHYSEYLGPVYSKKCVFSVVGPKYSGKCERRICRSEGNEQHFQPKARLLPTTNLCFHFLIFCNFRNFLLILTKFSEIVTNRITLTLMFSDFTF